MLRRFSADGNWDCTENGCSYDRAVFETILDHRDAARATAVARKLLASGIRIALTGGLAIEGHLCADGRARLPRPLNDLDFVVENFAAIPPSLASAFLVHHVHPLAAEGKTLLQLVDPDHAVRVDLFRAFGRTLSRGRALGGQTDPLEVASVEDLVARTTAHVCGCLRRGRPLDPKHARAFRRLLGLGRPDALDEAWRDHRQQLSISFGEATREASRLLDIHPELLVDEAYSTVVTACERCETSGVFRPAPPEVIVGILGYW